jgi:hypothetical protein
MNSWEKQKLAFNLSALLVCASGIAYFVMKYLMETDDPFSVVNHPWQMPALHAHVLVSPLLILCFGIVFQAHVARKLGKPTVPNRTSGLLSLGTFATMTVSGYLLQVVSEPALLSVVRYAHLISGAVFTAAYIAHLAISVRLARIAAIQPQRAPAAVE